MSDSIMEKLFAAPKIIKTEQEAIDAIVASQKSNSEPIDPNGAKRFVRALIAIGLFKPVV